MWPEADKTQELLNSARDGDSEAIDHLFTHHRESLRRMIDLRMDRRITRRVDASDIVQEVLIEASRRLTDFLANPSMPFHLWLRALARDHMISAHRKHRVAQKRSVDKERSIDAPAYGDHSSIQLAAQLVAGDLTPASAAIRNELARRFQDALTELEGDDAEIILMRHFEQLSNQDVAKALGFSEPAAGMRYLRALRKLRALLGPDVQDPSHG
jgi:RNA polymerase sigma-70 factor (ECF subfamily)